MNTQRDNFDPTELAKFSALAQRWWDLESEFRPLHQINPLRLEWIDRLATLRGKKVLDVGCGGGILAEAMAHKGAIVKGIDLAIKPLQVATLHAQQSGANVRYQAISAEELAQQEAGTYGVVTCMEMLEHVPRPEPVIQACARLVEPGGWVFFSTLNRNPLSWFMAIFGAEYVLRMLPRKTHTYSKFIKPDELKGWALAADLQTQDQHGLGYNPFTKAFRLHKFLGVGYLLAMQKK
ncbi:MAG: bifunctional 2-polyprenyl-6-hydroxyphenol methylase/3-demethylubiquinol 3-O-methyltransferase UbiG [Pseudomonadota bacterium]